MIAIHYFTLLFVVFASSGRGICNIKEHAIPFDRKSQLSWQHGVILTITPIRKVVRFTLSEQISLIRNGYAITIGRETFRYKFRYASLALLPTIGSHLLLD